MKGKKESSETRKNKTKTGTGTQTEVSTVTRKQEALYKQLETREVAYFAMYINMRKCISARGLYYGIK